MKYENIKKLIAKLRIPRGDYCYTIKKIIPDSVYGYRIKVKMCPYYHRVEDNFGDSHNECKCINVKDDILLDDQCKICGINEYEYED